MYNDVCNFLNKNNEIIDCIFLDYLKFLLIFFLNNNYPHYLIINITLI